MAQVNLVEKTVQMTHRSVIKYQLITHCFVKNLHVIDSELNCLTLLGASGETKLSDFCRNTVEEGIFKTEQTVRNFLTKVAKSGLVIKKGTNKKTVTLSPELKVQTKGNIMLNYKFIHIAT